MKKVLYIVFTFMLLFIFSLDVEAARGDLIYEVEKLILNDNSLTINGYAFIHKTNNYVTVYERNENGEEISDSIVKDNGGQQVKIRIVNANESKELVYTYTGVNDDYNFYYQMYSQDGNYSLSKYNNSDLNSCDSSKSLSHCYYEDIGFNIVIPVDEILETFSYEEEVWFEIAAYNHDYHDWTEYKSMKIVNVEGSSDHIEIVSGIPNGKVKFTAIYAQFQNLNTQLKYNNERYFAKTGSNYYIYDYNNGRYNSGFLKDQNTCYLNTCFLNHTYSPGKYAVCVDLSTGYDACETYGSNNYCINCKQGENVVLAAIYGSWIEFEGTGQLIIKINSRGCDPVTPSSGDLECNGGKEFSSTCDELTISTNEGNAKVKIEQTGTISSVLTPERTYAGSGFNFGVMYYNTIKWSYVDVVPNATLHAAVTSAMNAKLKDYSSYIAGLNLTEMKLGGKSVDSALMVKSCTTSNTNIDYYNKELEVSCVFYFPESELLNDGGINYTNGAVGSGISNKYYTPLDYSGEYKIEAKIVGMDRITNSDALNDSSEEGKKWTGNWDDTFKNCVIDIYDLFYKNGKYNFIYRPIDIYNPFPNRNAGINWFDWYNIERNKEKLEATYANNPQYSATLNNQSIADIKRYNANSTNGYYDWSTMTSGGNSTFVNDYFDTKRVGVE